MKENKYILKSKKSFGARLRAHFLAGILILMPFGITLLVMHWLFGWMAGFLKPILLKIVAIVTSNPAMQTQPPAYISLAASILSIIVLLVFICLAGLTAEKVVGKKLIAIGEALLLRIPVLRTIYGATKQVMSALSLPGKDAFLSVVLVDFPRPGLKAIGFLTGYIDANDGNKYCKVFIPTTPNPTTGFFEIIPCDQVQQTAFSVEEAFKMIISGGIISPDNLNLKSLDPPPQPFIR